MEFALSLLAMSLSPFLLRDAIDDRPFGEDVEPEPNPLSAVEMFAVSLHFLFTISDSLV